MELLQFLGDIITAITNFIGSILGAIERLIAPIIDIQERWDALFGGGEA